MARGQHREDSDAKMLAQGKEGTTRRDAPVPGSGADSDHLRLLFDNMLEGYAYCRMIFDHQGRPEDFVYVDVNRAFGRLTGLSDVVGKRVTEIIPDIKDSNPEVFTIYGRVARSGEPEQFELDLEQLGIVLSISVFRPEPDHFVAVFEDVTQRKRDQERLDELIRYLEFRVEQRTNDLAEALRILNRPSGEGEGSGG